MDKQKVRDRIIEIGIVPVVRASSAGEACVAADAVCQGGIPIVEIGNADEGHNEPHGDSVTTPLH